jgi:hypothetical protein
MSSIRNILSKLENLTESRGLAGRKSGDMFVDPATKDMLVFNDLTFFPSEGGAFKPEELDSVIKSVEDQIQQKISWENQRSPRTGGFAIASLSKNDEPIFVGTFLQTVKPNPVDNYVPNLILKTYRFAGKAAEKAQAGFTPQDILTQKSNLSAADILNQIVSKFGEDHVLSQVALHIVNGGELPLEITNTSGNSFTAFRDYFCELLQPMALQNGLVTGNADEAEEKFLAPEGFASTLISFDDDKTAGLSDSMMALSDGRYIRVSSKGNKGAEASVKNLADSIDAVMDTEEGKKLAEKYKETLDVITTTRSMGQAGAPLHLGVRYEIITTEEAQKIVQLKNAPLVNINDEAQLRQFRLTPKMVELINGRSTKSPEQTSLYYHLIAAVAHLVAKYVNENTNFSDAAADILNNGALVQVYTKATQKGERWVLEGFSAEYPSKAVTGVVFSAQKNYSSTSIKGNFTFKILRNKAEAAPEDTTDEVPSSGDDLPDFDTAKAAKKDKVTKAFRGELPDTDKGPAGRMKR